MLLIDDQRKAPAGPSKRLIDIPNGTVFFGDVKDLTFGYRRDPHSGLWFKLPGHVVLLEYPYHIVGCGAVQLVGNSEVRYPCVRNYQPTEARLILTNGQKE
jgi:hypothetical protein